MPRQLIALIACLLVATGALAAPKAELWQRWAAHRPESTMTVDHAAWDALLKEHLKWLKVEEEMLSLDDIEQRILRPIWKDPRIHYAVNCTSVGCPNLSRTAYRGGNFDGLAEAAARAYINSPRGVRVEGGRLHVSSIYEWFKADFGGTDAGVIAHLTRYAVPALAAELATVARIDGDSYDWSLNDAR